METLVDAKPLIDVDPNNYINDPNIEMHWAMKAYQHAEVYFNILSAVDTKFLKLTKIDEIVYQEFRDTFKDFQVGTIDVELLKSAEAKEVWRPFCESFKERVEDYNMATLIRIDSNLDYSEENTTLVPRIQFYAIEIARNKEGKNDTIKAKYGKASNKTQDSNNNDKKE